MVAPAAPRASAERRKFPAACFRHARRRSQQFRAERLLKNDDYPVFSSFPRRSAITHRNANSMNSPWRRRAFTLLELRAVLAILAGLAIPVFGRMKRHANQTACLSNLRPVAAAMLS